MSRKIVEFFKTFPLTEVPKEYQQCQVIVKDIREGIANGRVGDFIIRPITDKDKKLDEKSKKLEHKCRFCEKTFALASYLSGHMIRFHSEQLKGLLECQICHKKFIKKHGLKRHMKVKHFDGKIHLFECDFCGKLTKTKGEMKQHMRIHLPIVNCDICHAEFKQFSIKVHMNEMHAEDRRFQCKMCPKMFKTRTILRRHQKIHNKKFQCTKCIKTFPLKCQLFMHQKEVHENPGSYSCEICDKKFNTKGNLQDHLKIHDRNRPKPFKCDRCEFETDSNRDFKKHQKFHERKDEKFSAMKNPLKCSKCSTLCRNKRALRYHLKYVHPDEPFQCDLCGRYIKTMFNLKIHINLYHQQKIKFVNQ